MRIKHWILLSIVLAVFLLMVVFHGEQPPRQPNNESKVVSQNRGSQITPSPVVMENVNENMLVREETEEPKCETDSVKIRLVNALDDPIPNGRITLASRTYESAWSDFEIKEVTQGTHTLVAEAEGYFSATETVSLPAKQPVEMILEYKCAFEIEVRQGSTEGAPVEGATVVLYGGPRPPRPVKRSLSVTNWRNPRGGELTGSLMLECTEDEIVVSRALGRQPSQDYTNAKGDTFQREVTVQSQDLVVGLRPMEHRKTDLVEIGSVLRLWDSVAAISSDPEDRCPWGVLTFKRREKIFQTAIYGYRPVNRTPPIQSAVTDVLGQCQFEELPPRVYYTRAHRGSMQSRTYTICPDYSFLRLALQPSTVNTVQVFAVRANCQYRKNKSIRSFRAQLEGLDRRLILSKDTTESVVTFEAVPSGQYELTVTPAEKFDSDPSSKQVKVLVEDPNTIVEVEFEVEFGVTVSGIVFRQDTREPVAGYPLRLMIGLNTRTQIWKPFAATRSDAKGRFQFVHVTPGSFLLSSFPVREFDTGYIHLGKAARLREHLQTGRRKGPYPAGDPRLKTEPHFQVSNKDIKGIEYAVLPAVHTRLTGQVTTEDGRPVSDAKIEVENISSEEIRSGEYTDELGRFSLVLLLPMTENPIQTTVCAYVSAPPVERVSINSEGQHHIDYFDAGIAADGGTPVSFRTGETLSDIHIVVNPVDRGHVLFGKIVTEQGNVPENVQSVDVEIVQHEQQGTSKMKAWIDPDGSYRVDRLKPGHFTLRVRTGYRWLTPDNIDLPPPVTYANQENRLEMPPDTKEIQHDIILRRDSYIHGRVVDESLQPITEHLKHVLVTADPIEGSVGASTSVNSDGYFLLEVPPGNRYRLRIRNQQNGLYYSSDLGSLMPPVENVTIQVNPQEGGTEHPHLDTSP